MDSEHILRIFEQTDALVRNSHVVLASGRHSDSYFNKDKFYRFPVQVSIVCNQIARLWQHTGVDAVIAPAVGGINLSTWTAYHLTQITGRQVLALYADKTGDKEFEVRRGYDADVPGRRILVVEDVLTTGGSVHSVIKAVRAVAGGKDPIVGLCVLVNRGGVTPENVGNIPTLHALVSLPFLSWPEEDCPLCKERIIEVRTDIGHGKDFLSRKAHTA